MKLKNSASSKTKLSSTLKSWLPVLQSSVSDLEESLNEFSDSNPFLDIQSTIQTPFSAQKKKSTNNKESKRSSSENIELFYVSKEKLLDILYEQISPPLFPTQNSVKIAHKIIEFLDEDGYFDGDVEEIAKSLDVNSKDVEKIRERFAYLDPPGIGSRDIKESFFFQLQHIDIPPKVYDATTKLIENLDNLNKFKKIDKFNEAIKIIKSFKNPPAIEHSEDDGNIIPDIFVFEMDGNIVVELNNKAYPQIHLNLSKADTKCDYVKHKLKEAKDLIDALEMRKATLYKIGLMIVEYQYDFFRGGEIKPMKLKDIADEFSHVPSTISRAISNKYLECDRGIVSIKSFFTTAVDDDLSNSSIKNYIEEIIKNEPKSKPLSDIKILKIVEDKFKLKMVRRTITKYRIQLNIASSSERKKTYELECES